ncbi:hypothetical protein AB0E69_02885 [Kribbella sp. NPDC026611]|uniref:hypothetical protein n=1 Tax=Kribbella sp. NPDC026611 TaxID=3154911 RepID=UPI003410A465
MCGTASDAHCLLIDSKLLEAIMFFYSADSLRAETRYRQERIRRDFQRPLWFLRRPQPQPPQPCAPELRARPAM